MADRALPLYKHTVFGNYAGVEEWYTFELAVSLSSGQEDKARTWVRLSLPPAIHDEGSAARHSRDAFEEILILHGLLLDGVKVVDDEWS